MNMLETKFIEAPDDEDYAVLVNGIRAHAREAKDIIPSRHGAYFIYDQNEVIGGIGLHVYLSSLSLERLWVHPLYRGQGLARLLIEQAENYGRKEGCRFALLSTMDWEALELYLKSGYTIEFKREGYDKDSILYYLRKDF